MRPMIKKAVKIFLCVLGSIFLTLMVLLLLLKYEISWKLTDVGLEKSPDGRYSVRFQSVGEADWPFGYSHAKVTVKDGDRIVESFREDIADDGGQFRPANYAVEWTKYGVVITFMGSEQPDREVEVFFDGRDSFSGYTDEEIKSILHDRYNIEKVDKIEKDDDGYAIRANGVDFRADTHMALHDSYAQELFKAVTDGLFRERIRRSLEWDVMEGLTPSDLIYTPIIAMNGPGSQDIDSYCNDICEWLDGCFEVLPYESAKDMYDATGFIVSAPEHGNLRYIFADLYTFKHFSDERVEFYNDLYLRIDRYLNHEYDVFTEQSTTGNSGDTVDELYETDSDTGASGNKTDDYPVWQWATYDYDVYYDHPDGREYALVPVDRALGSSYYVLLSFKEKGNPDSAELINPDPFNGQGGEARFITFLGDGMTGFAALSYAGGSQGLLFETLDGGKSYHEVTLPSPGIKLPNGQIYNPFVMPEEVWEESGIIYLKVGQGPDGDHHSEALGGARTVGIYSSDDKGKTFEFVREE